MRPMFRGRTKAKGAHVMNKTEAAYAAELERRIRASEIVWFKYEALTFRLAKLTSYTPDFIVMLPDGTIEAHEVKGNWGDQSGRVKIKIAAEMFPMTFIAVTKGTRERKGQWLREVFGNASEAEQAVQP